MTSFDAELTEGLRDAMLALYLHEAVPKNAYIVQQGLVDNIKTPTDLYEFWLLDVLVSQDVPTSPVACAIASLQQLINSMMMNMEPGYSDHSLSPEQLSAWQNGLNRYPIWAGLQQLLNFPDIYLDPTLRPTKTDSFKQLEDDITQAQIQPETIQAAVLAYLGRFEEIANLRICNGYIDGEDFANSHYYFIAHSPAESAYYWRALDMSQRPLKAPTASSRATPAKYDKPLPYAWQDWQRATVPISDKAVQHTIRPCWFNNRLFIVWAQIDNPDPNLMEPAPTTHIAQEAVKSYPLFRLYGCYKKYDDTWSTPRIYIESPCQTPALIGKSPEDIAAQTHSIAVYDHSTSPESMVLMLYSGYVQNNDETGDKDQYEFLRSVRIDKNFNLTALFPSNGSVLPDLYRAPRTPQDDSRAHVLLMGRTFANNKKNQGRFQFWLPSSVPVFGAVVTTSPSSPSWLWNSHTWQSKIKTVEKDLDLIYDREKSNVTLKVSLNQSFEKIREEHLTLYGDDQKTIILFRLVLLFDEASLHDGFYTLLPGSILLPVDIDFFDQPDTIYTFSSYFRKKYQSVIFESNGEPQLLIPRTPKGKTTALTNKLLSQKAWISITYDGGYLDSVRRNVPLETIQVKANMQRITGGPFDFSLVVACPTNVQAALPPTDMNGIQILSNSSPFVNRLSKDARLEYTFSIDQNTYQPEGWGVSWPKDKESIEIPLIYGVLVFDHSNPLASVEGGALKMVRLAWGAEPGSTPQIAPWINTSSGVTPSLGEAQFIDFSGSSIQHSDNDNSSKKLSLRDPIRMNTTFARHLIERAESGMQSLLAWDTQDLLEPPLRQSATGEFMDFAGGYSLYFLELFLYLPWLVAYRLNQEQQYDEAKRWLAYLFNPTRQTDESGHPGYWQARPLEEPAWLDAPDPSQAMLYSYDPHRIALSFPVHLRKALYGLYIDIESNQADAAYLEQTPDGLAEAKLRYTRILDLLGERPDARQTDDWTPITLSELSSAQNNHLRQFEQALLAAQDHVRAPTFLRIGPAAASTPAPLLCLRPFTVDTALSSLDNPYLLRPFNPELIKRWERAQSRLYNLRHNLDIGGNAMDLPLFATPIDPRALLAARAQGISGSGLDRLLNPQIPHYRFSFMFALAQNAVESVIQFGSTLLSLIERKEQAHYLELQQRQAWDLAKAAVDIQLQLSSVDDANREALSAAQAIAQGRVDYYEKLTNEGSSFLEKLSIDLRLRARLLEASAGGFGSAAEMLKMVPNIFGFSIGGARIEGASQAPIHLLQATATVLHGTSDTLSAYEQYRRRAQEWTQAGEQARQEVAHIEAQRKVLEEQHKATRLQVRQAQTALNQAKTTYDFLLSNNRFSQAQTYEWLNGRFASFYASAFATAQSICKAAEACWQYETSRYEQSFIRPGVWNNSYRGLGAGEELKVALQQMYREYVQQHVRDLEIRKTVSLKALWEKDKSSSINKPWDQIKAALLAGSCDFELTQKMFDDDYAGQNHYLRRIKTISLSFPVVMGPYEDLRAILVQRSSRVEMSSTLGALPKDNLRVNQQIALSRGFNDDGQFQLDYHDERYLPFEYTGAISSWRLIFPNPTAQKAVLESLTDVIAHISYTARPGGGSS